MDHNEIPTKRAWTAKIYNQEIKPLKTEIQHDGDENIEYGLFVNNKIEEMKNLEFILNGNVYLNDTDEFENYNNTYGPYDMAHMSHMVCSVVTVIIMEMKPMKIKTFTIGL